MKALLARIKLQCNLFLFCDALYRFTSDYEYKCLSGALCIAIYSHICCIFHRILPMLLQLF